jgi:hypothetical protein
MTAPRPGSIAPQQHHGLPLQIYRIAGRTATGVKDGQGSDVQFVYTVTAVYNRATVGGSYGYGSTWSSVASGEWFGPTEDTAVENTAKAYNFLEWGADGTGRQPSGVNVDGTCFTTNSAAIQPLQTGSIHPGILVPLHPGDYTGDPLPSYTIWLFPYQAWDG